MIKQITVYRNDKDQALEQETLCDGSGFPQIGESPTFWLPLNVTANTQVGAVPVAVRIQVEALDVGEAFTKIDATIKAKLQSAVEEALRKEIARRRDQAQNGPMIQRPR